MNCEIKYEFMNSFNNMGIWLIKEDDLRNENWITWKDLKVEIILKYKWFPCYFLTHHSS